MFSLGGQKPEIDGQPLPIATRVLKREAGNSRTLRAFTNFAIVELASFGERHLRQSGGNVGPPEILPFEQKSLSGSLGERVREAVPEVQVGRMAAFAEIKEGLPCEMGMFHSDRLNPNAGSTEKHLALPAGLRPELAFNHYGQLNVIRCTDQAAVCVVDELHITGGFWFSEENRDKRGSIEDHFGSPWLS